MKLICKTTLFVALLWVLGGSATAQEKKVLEALKEYVSDESSLFEDISGIKKKTDRFNLYMNMKGSVNGEFDKSSFQKGHFNMDQLRIEAKGNVNSWLSYRWRQRLNVSSDGSKSIDNLPSAIDYAGIGVQVAPKFGLFMGKQGVAYGGMEYDLNPIEIYQYAQFLERLPCFLTGLNMNYKLNSKHELNLQIANNRIDKELEQVELANISEVEDAKMPFIYTLNWNGALGKHFETRWSFSFINEAKDENKMVLSLGNAFKFGKFGGYFDYMYSREQLDRTGLVRDAVFRQKGFQKIYNIGTSYHAMILHLNYRITPNWNVLAKGAFEFANLNDDLQYKANDTLITLGGGDFSKTLSYAAGVEYYPMEKSNLHFFLVYSGRAQYMKKYGKHFQLDNTAVSKVSLGFVYQLKMF